MPASHTRMAMRAIAGVQDAATFQEARDALLRYYYPVLRTFRRQNAQDPNNFTDVEGWSVDLLHSGSRTSAALFCEHIWREKGRLDSEQVQEIADGLQSCVLEARKADDATPYERVGRVLNWLKKTRHAQGDFKWEHSGLRKWMEGLLTDFTLADAKKRPGSLLDVPEQHYQKMVASWEAEKTAFPFNALWKIKGERWYTKNAVALGMENLDAGVERVTEAVFNLRAKLVQEAVPAMALMVHSHLGATRQLRPSWRDVTDYGVLHPLLTLDEASFDKGVWLDFLQHQGEKWSIPENKDKWHSWQADAQASYQNVLQAYTGSTPHAFVHSDRNDISDNPLKADARSPLSLDWYKVFSQLAFRFAYLNEAPDFEALAQSKMNSEEFEKFKLESRQRVGQPLILALLELPEDLQRKNVFNMPDWFHARLKEEMTEKSRLQLPEGIADDNQEPPLY